MDLNLKDQERYLEAKKKVEEIKGFYTNLAAYIVVNIVLFMINMKTAPYNHWFYYPLFWWGLGVVLHGLKVFSVLPSWGREWERKKIREFMEKERRNINRWE